MLMVDTNRLELVFKKLVFAFVVLVFGQQYTYAQNETAIAKSQPSLTHEEHKLLESRVREVVHDVSPAVVAVESPMGGITRESKEHHNHFINCGTGVIVSSDGMVLSQWHVSHKRADGSSEKPGTTLSLVLHDGRKVKAKLLGASQVLDLSAIQITTPGVYPYLEFADKSSAKIGDRVFRIGHPFGYRADRRNVARFGTVIYTGDHIDLVADCQVDGGDSGGPLIDMQGRLLGIAAATSAPFVANWIISARSGFPFNHHDTSTIATFLAAVKSTSKATTEELDLSEKHDPKVRLEQMLEEGLHPADHSILNPRDWTQGERNLSQWRSQSNPYSEKLVQLYRNKIPCAIGTCVAKGGWVISKASELGEVPQFQTKSGNFVEAKIVETDFASDLALLRVDLDLQPVEWHVSAEPIGTFVVAPDPHGQPMLAGIVSVSTRKIANRKKDEQIVAPGRTTIPASLDIFPYFDRPGVVVHHVRNDAAEKGLKNGDVILKIDDVEIRNPEEMNNHVSTVAGNQEVAITVRRNDEVQIYKVNLSPLPYFECPGAISQYANMRCDDFPEVLEHDIPLALNECGGPVVALDGRALGINIARVGDHGSMAIPAAAIVAQVEKWQRFIDPTSVSAATLEDSGYSIPIRIVLLICICCLSFAGLYVWKKRTSVID